MFSLRFQLHLGLFVFCDAFLFLFIRRPPITVRCNLDVTGSLVTEEIKEVVTSTDAPVDFGVEHETGSVTVPLA